MEADYGEEQDRAVGEHMESDNYIQIMMDSLVQKIAILEKISVLNIEQKGIAEMAEFDEQLFHDNADKKEALIEAILKLDDGFDSLFARVSECLEGNRDKYREQIGKMQGYIKQITDLSVQVQAQEMRNKKLLEQKFSSMRKDLHNAKRSTKMANTYYKNMNKLSNDSYFLDQKN